MVFLSHTRSPLVTGCDMGTGRMFLSIFFIEVLAVGAAGDSIVVPEEAAFT